MQINTLLKEIKKENYHKQIVYSFPQIIHFEASNYCFIKNPLLKKLNVKSYKFFAISNNSYQEWSTPVDQKITNKRDIEFVIKDSKKTIKRNMSKVKLLLNKDYDKLRNKQLISILNSMNKMSIAIYKRYIFFIGEYFDTNDKRLLKILPKVRLELSKFVDKLNKICNKLIESSYYRFEKKISWKTFIYATSEEIINLLNNPNAKTIKEFKKILNRPIIFYFDGKKVNVIKGKSDVSKVITILKQNVKSIPKSKEIKGRPAFKGIVRGKVIVISEFDYEHIEKILRNKKDYVLVTPMTRPEFVPYLEKAIAIVTDEGGITCHAAIVSRELKKVCIVGTKHATQILKTGDLVEVDANTGKVIIL